jgi:epoxyqueuosine reductase QueG
LREKIEEAFKETTNRLDGARTRVLSRDTLKGRIFCQFVGLNYHCFLHKKIKELKERLEKDCKDESLSAQEKDDKADLLKWCEGNQCKV